MLPKQKIFILHCITFYFLGGLIAGKPQVNRNLGSVRPFMQFRPNSLVSFALYSPLPLWVGGLVKYNFIAYFDFQSCQTLDWNKVSYWNKPVTFITFYIHSLGAGQLGQDERGLVGAKLSSPAVCLLT